MNLREWALPVYTILSQLAFGAFFALWVILTLANPKINREKLEEIAKIPLLIIVFTILFAVAGAHFHLSKPFLSFLAMRNFRTSWLSREIVFNVLFFLLTFFLLVLLWLVAGRHLLKAALGWGAIAAGFATVYCMANIYLLPTQIVWNSPATILSYFATTLLLGTPSLIVILLMDLRFSESRDPSEENFRVQIVKKAIIGLTVVSVLAAIWAFVLDLGQISSLRMIEHEDAQTSLNLLFDLYQPILVLRFSLLTLGVGWLVISIWLAFRRNQAIKRLIGPVYLACLLIIVAEILERFLFYAAHVRIGI